mmetsp:Transcript_9811/g.14640  ORF Transcript_9811/g.14640 Transcript_9811/m.14640 type:complete len:168 (-) Transcript_9811:41-544(-)
MGAIINNEGGAPLLPQGIQGSISHKDDIAVGAALPFTSTLSKAIGLGVDIERCRPSSPSWRLLRRLLTPREREHQLRIHYPQIQQSKDFHDNNKEEDEEEESLTIDMEEDVMLRFSFKEAVFKALHPTLQRPISFQEVEIYPESSNLLSSFNTSSQVLIPHTIIIIF